MKTVKFIWATSLCVALSMGLVSCGDDNEEIEPSPNKESSGKVNGHECVDLGLNVKWATCNVGASSPEEYGDYYAWGETETKSTYSWNTYKWGNSFSTLTKYCTNSDYGTVDNKMVLESSDDVAQVKWGGSWRMPTEAEMTELREQCTWTWTTQGGTNGCKVTSKKNGNSVFLPAAGYCFDGDVRGQGYGGYYWSSMPDGSGSAYGLGFDSGYQSVNDVSRFGGFSVRAVLAE